MLKILFLIKSAKILPEKVESEEEAKMIAILIYISKPNNSKMKNSLKLEKELMPGNILILCNQKTSPDKMLKKQDVFSFGIMRI